MKGGFGTSKASFFYEVYPAPSPEHYMRMRFRKRRSNFITQFLARSFMLLCLLALVAAALFYHPKTPLPDAWNPVTAFDPNDPLTLVTDFKLARATMSAALCRQALKRGKAGFTVAKDRHVSASCHIKARQSVRKLGTARIKPLDTTCPTALRLLMWEIHAVQPAAKAIFDQPVTRIQHFGSYSCRVIAGTKTMSQHATANAIDISGFVLADGTKISLKRNWNGPPKQKRFLRKLRKGGCRWFRTTLSPDYNAAHADHFHMDNGRWQTCR